MEKKIINEIDRLSVSIPTTSWRTAFVHMVHDAFDGWKIINRPDDKGFADRNAVSLVTYDRAVLTVTQKLLVNGRAIKPEKYLALWRETEELTIETLFSKHGMTIQINGKFDLDAERSNKWNTNSQSGSSLTSFVDFEERYKQHFEGSDFTMQLKDGKQSRDFMHMAYNFARLSPGYVQVSDYSISFIESNDTTEVSGMGEIAHQFDFFGEPA